MSRRGAERLEDTESEAGSRLWAVLTEPNAGLEPINHKIVTWAKVRRLTDWATQAPFLTFLTFIYFWETEWAGEGQREGETQNPKQAPGSELSAQSPEQAGLELTNREIMTWAEVGSSTNWATQVPHLLFSLPERGSTVMNMDFQFFFF